MTGTTAADDGAAVPAKPVGLQVRTEPGSLDVGLDWDDVDGITHYLVRWRGTGPEDRLNEGLESEVSETEIAVTDFGQWVVRVQACSVVGCSEPNSRQFSVAPAPKPTPIPEPKVRLPAKPSGLQVELRSEPLELTASWEAVAEASHYRVAWREHGASRFEPDDQLEAESTSASFRVVRAGAWVVRLEACNAAGCGPGTSQAIATTPAAPANLAVSTTPGGLDVTATWDAAAGATEYRLRWRPFDGNFAPGAETSSAVTTATFTLPDHGHWAVRLEACNAAGCGPGEPKRQPHTGRIGCRRDLGGGNRGDRLPPALATIGWEL